eukprot:CAMPEP_0202445504 /NCGR_PEP_ID=MMETSP1360-20130828/4320_1 /ASSEMBLY_ACC=CAM_ASM_000848 /TAXON_ID=515479 /ORGANISM="Licmophora paradoxa, Strain CCMP2313" /LENGTH=82 /DNA_ID=CAMNT_0049061801 /DNA_START=42 /DNA_END=287 /DNA_ORIENTATION=+
MTEIAAKVRELPLLDTDRGRSLLRKISGVDPKPDRGYILWKMELKRGRPLPHENISSKAPNTHQKGLLGQIHTLCGSLVQDS